MRWMTGLLVMMFFFSGLVLAADKKEMSAMHHLIKVRPSKNINIPDSFKLNDEHEIDCLTCHGIKNIEDIPLDDINKNEENFFREGPYIKITDFCYRCHQQENYKRLNVHVLLDKNGKIKKKQCLYCHMKKPDLKADRYSDLEFRLPPEKLCYGCHLKSPHLNASNHNGKPDKKMSKRIKYAEKKQGIIFPLDKQGKIMCVTCHTSHQIDLIDREKPAGKQVADTSLNKGISYRKHDWNSVYQDDKQQRLSQLSGAGNISLEYQRIENEVLLRLSAKDGSLCLSCHEFEK